MVKKQVYLTVAQDTQLKRLAEQQRRSQAEVLRDALDRYLPNPQPLQLADDALFRLVERGAARVRVICPSEWTICCAAVGRLSLLFVDSSAFVALMD